MSTENATGAEVLALKAIARLLLAEKIREYKDEAAAAFEFASICSGIVNESHLVAQIPKVPNKRRFGIWIISLTI